MKWWGGGEKSKEWEKGFEMRCIDSRVENHTANSRLCKAMKKCSPREEVRRAFEEPEEIHTYHEKIHYILKHVHKCLLLLRKGAKERFLFFSQSFGSSPSHFQPRRFFSPHSWFIVKGRPKMWNFTRFYWHLCDNEDLQLTHFLHLQILVLWHR